MRSANQKSDLVASIKNLVGKTISIQDPDGPKKAMVTSFNEDELYLQTTVRRHTFKHKDDMAYFMGKVTVLDMEEENGKYVHNEATLPALAPPASSSPALPGRHEAELSELAANVTDLFSDLRNTLMADLQKIEEDPDYIKVATAKQKTIGRIMDTVRVQSSLISNKKR